MKNKLTSQDGNKKKSASPESSGCRYLAQCESHV